MVAIVAKCKEIKNLAQKYQFGDIYWRKKIAGENFCLALERHLPLKVIDSCRPCITSHNSVADGVKPEHDASHTSDICQCMRRPKPKTASLRVTETAF